MLQREQVLLTGASSGIGLELARLAAQDGKDVILVARSREKLLALAEELTVAHGVRATVIVADLGAPEGARQLYDEVASQGLTVDILINNAGYGLTGPYLQTDGADELAMIRLNVMALTELTKLFLPAMVQRGRGRIMNVASVAAFMPGPYMAIYYATKAYVLSYSEALAKELAGTGVTVTALCPGPLLTGFQERARMQISTMMKAMLTDVRYVARTGYSAMMKGRTVVVPGLLNRLTTIAVAMSPRAIVRAAVAIANRAR